MPILYLRNLNNVSEDGSTDIVPLRYFKRTKSSAPTLKIIGRDIQI